MALLTSKPSSNRPVGQTQVFDLYQRCLWYDLALMRHGFTTERLDKLARKVAHDALALRGASLGDRFEDLVSRLRIVGLQCAIRFDPLRHHESYGRHGGEPFASYVADVMGKRVDDFFRSKAEGFGDRRYGNDRRIVLSDDIGEDVDPDVDFGSLISERRVGEWQAAAEMVGMSLAEWVAVTLDRASLQIRRTQAA